MNNKTKMHSVSSNTILKDYKMSLSLFLVSNKAFLKSSKCCP